MIIKRTRGVSAVAALAYDHGPGRAQEHTNPRRVAGSVGGTDWRDRARAMQAKLRADGDAEKGRRGRVIRLAIAAAPGDRIMSDREWGQIATRVIQEFTGDADAYWWEAVRHDAGHIHITLLQRSVEGRLLSESHDFRRFGRISEGLERDYGLQRVAHDRAITAERRRARTVQRQRAAAMQRGPQRARVQEQTRAPVRETTDGRDRGRGGIER